MRHTPRVLVAAGEVSGDRMAGALVRELRARWPDARFFGAGGVCLGRAGVELRHRVDRLSVTGLTEAARRVPAAAHLLADLTHQMARRAPVLAVLVDFPGVNLRLAAVARRLGVPVLYYGAPQRWAWLERRVGALRRRVQRLAVTLPFEESWFRRRGVPATYVGHPAVDLFRPLETAEARRALGLDARQEVLALLPGSRDNEIRRHLPLLLDAARRLPRLTPVLAVAPGVRRELFERLVPAGIRRAPSAVALGAASTGLCASGTATLELALAGVPAVVLYRLSRPSYWVARRLVRVPWVALPNLVLGRALLPELLQDEATPARLAREAARLLEPGRRRAVASGLREVVQRLGPGGVAGRVADLAQELVGGGLRPRR